MHLFSKIKYEIGGQEIEKLNHPGIAGVIMGTAKFPYEYVSGVGMQQCWCPETSEGILMEKAFACRKEYIIENSSPTRAV